MKKIYIDIYIYIYLSIYIYQRLFYFKMFYCRVFMGSFLKQRRPSFLQLSGLARYTMVFDVLIQEATRILTKIFSFQALRNKKKNELEVLHIFWPHIGQKFVTWLLKLTGRTGKLPSLGKVRFWNGEKKCPWGMDSG